MGGQPFFLLQFCGGPARFTHTCAGKHTKAPTHHSQRLCHQLLSAALGAVVAPQPRARKLDRPLAAEHVPVGVWVHARQVALMCEGACTLPARWGKLS